METITQPQASAKPPAHMLNEAGSFIRPILCLLGLPGRHPHLLGAPYLVLPRLSCYPIPQHPIPRPAMQQDSLPATPSPSVPAWLVVDANKYAGCNAVTLCAVASSRGQ